MNLPAGLIFYLDFQYGTTGDGFTATDSLYNASDDQKRNELPARGERGGLYGAGTFGYSLNTTSSQIAGTSASAALTGILNFDTQFSASKHTEFGGATGATSVVRTLIFTTSSLANFDVEGIRACTLSGFGTHTLFPQFTRINAGNIEFVVSAAAALQAATGVSVVYPIGPDNLDDRGDFEEG